MSTGIFRRRFHWPQYQGRTFLPTVESVVVPTTVPRLLSAEWGEEPQPTDVYRTQTLRAGFFAPVAATVSVPTLTMARWHESADWTRASVLRPGAVTPARGRGLVAGLADATDWTPQAFLQPNKFAPAAPSVGLPRLVQAPWTDEPAWDSRLTLVQIRPDSQGVPRVVVAPWSDDASWTAPAILHPNRVPPVVQGVRLPLVLAAPWSDDRLWEPPGRTLAHGNPDAVVVIAGVRYLVVPSGLVDLTAVEFASGARFVLPPGDLTVVAPLPIGAVPIRYVVGQTENVVPVETVATNEPGTVPCRVFVGPQNVVPVRETSTEVPRVKIRLV